MWIRRAAPALWRALQAAEASLRREQLGAPGPTRATAADQPALIGARAATPAAAVADAARAQFAADVQGDDSRVLELQYVSVADAATARELEAIDARALDRGVMVSIAAACADSGTRLIDNIVVRQSELGATGHRRECHHDADSNMTACS